MDVDVYQSYTQALRHPVIIGHVAGWRLPWALSASQLAAIAGASGLMLVTRPVWAHLGAVGNLAVFSVVVVATAWTVRHWRIEGRSPFLVAAGLAKVLLSPRCRRGIRNGTPTTTLRPVSANPVGLVVATLEGAADG